jgi:hypothetical protein
MENQVKKRGGRPRTRKKLSYTAKFMQVNRDYFTGGTKADLKKIKEVR